MELKKAPAELKEMAAAVLCKHDTHKPLLDAKVRIDYLLAYPDKDTEGNYTGDALRDRGFKVLGLAKIRPYDQRVSGLGDAVVMIDGEWWEECKVEEQKEALLDHELHHFDVRKDSDDNVIKDKESRPMLRMRKHDVQIGWFTLVAERNGKHSAERIQAERLMETCGQFFWPSLLPQMAKKAD